MNLEQKIQSYGGALNMLRASNDRTVIFPGIPPEFTNWRDEQRAHEARARATRTSAQ